MKRLKGIPLFLIMILLLGLSGCNGDSSNRENQRPIKCPMKQLRLRITQVM